MKKRIMLFRMAGITGLLAAFVLWITPALIPDNVGFPYDVTRKIRGFYEEPKNSLDLIFVGSSELFSTINPAVLWREQGIPSYVFAANEQNLRLSYYYIKEALRYQNPQAIVLDMFYCDFGSMQREAVVRLNLEDMRWSWNKVLAIWDNVPAGQRMSYFLPIIKYHERYRSLSVQDFKRYTGKNPYKGWSPFEEIPEEERREDPKTPEEIAEVTERHSLDQEAVFWLDKIVSYCREQQMELIFLKVPNEDLICLPADDYGYRKVNGQPYYNAVADYAKEQGLAFLNYNVIMEGTGHNDVLRSQQVTSHFGWWYAETHHITNKRGLPEYAGWDEDAQLAYEYIEQATKGE